MSLNFRKTFLVGLCITFLILSCSGSRQAQTDFDSAMEKIVSEVLTPEIPDRQINLIEYAGFKPDPQGKHDFRKKIQSAIDLLASQGGGTLWFPNTRETRTFIKYHEIYRIHGPIELRSNIRLLLDPSITLFFEYDPKAYLPNGKPVLTRYEGTTLYTLAPCIRAFRAENVVIESTGGNGAMPCIDGDGQKWQRWMWDGETARKKAGRKPAYQALKDINNADVPVRERIFDNPHDDFFRPHMMQFFMCSRVRVEGIKITNSPFWCVHPVFSEHVTIRGIAYDAYVANNDGIDPESSHHVLIENVLFSNADDNVAIKAGRDKEGRDGADIRGTELEGVKSRYISNNRIGGPTESIVIRNNVFKGHYAIAIGSEMSGGVRHVYADNNRSLQDVNMGFFIKSSRTRGGMVEDIHIRNLSLNKVDKDVISMIPNYDNDSVSPHPPVFRDIHVQNVTANTAGNGIRIYGWSDSPVRNVSIKDVRVAEVSEEKFVVEEAENIRLKNVQIGTECLDGDYSRRDSEGSVPYQN